MLRAKATDVQRALKLNKEEFDNLTVCREPKV